MKTKLEEKIKCDFKECKEFGKCTICYKDLHKDCELYKLRFDTTGTYGRCH